MSQQETLFHERFEDALATVIDRYGRKKMADELWPDKSARDQHNAIDACLNPERRERFTPSQVVFIARKGRAMGCHEVMRYLCMELGYVDPQPVEPLDEAAELMRDYITAVKSQEKIADRMEKAASRLNIRAVA